MRWNENFSSILKEKKYNIIWTAVNGTLDKSSDVIVEVEYDKLGMKHIKELKEFLGEEVDESLHEYIRTNVFTATRNFIQRLKAFRREIMMGPNNPMAIENFSDKMEFQGRGAGHIHGSAWCNLRKISEDLDIDCYLTDSEDDFESDIEEEDETAEQEHVFDSESHLEKAFKKLRKSEKLKKNEEKALVAFADKFTTCTLNPDMAAKMIDEKTDHSEGVKIVEIAEESQCHYHT